MDDRPQTFAQAMANKNAALAQQAIALREQNQRLMEALTEIEAMTDDPLVAAIARRALVACASVGVLPTTDPTSRG